MAFSWTMKYLCQPTIPFTTAPTSNSKVDAGAFMIFPTNLLRIELSIFCLAHGIGGLYTHPDVPLSKKKDSSEDILLGGGKYLPILA